MLQKLGMSTFEFKCICNAFAVDLANEDLLPKLSRLPSDPLSSVIIKVVRKKQTGQY